MCLDACLRIPFSLLRPEATMILKPSCKYLYVFPFKAFSMVFALSAATAHADVAQSPLFLTSFVKPNVMLMIDNSLSMKDEVPSTGTGTTYNPETTYLDGLCTYNSKSSKNRALSTGTTYTTSVPSDFLGTDNGNKCFDPGRSYNKFNSAMTSLLTAAGATSDASKANYLNWYYTNQLAITSTSASRLSIAKTAATNLVNSLNDVRLGLSTFNNDDGGKLLEVIDDLSETKKKNIVKSIENLSALGYTPLSETLADIGRYFATGNSGDLKLHPNATSPTTSTVATVLPSELIDGTNWSGRTAIADEPSFSTAPIQYSCQRNFNVILTDGLPTRDRNISTSLADYDGDCSGELSNNCTPTPNYDMKKAYAYPGGNGGTPDKSVGVGDQSSDYFDDVAQALYEIDLRPDLKKTGKEKNNLTTYVVGFADDTVNPTITGVNPLPKDAALQGGGKFYFAGNSTELAGSLASAFSFIAEQSSASSSVATNSTQFQADTLIYQAVFDSGEWSGDLKALLLVSEDNNGNGKLDSGEDANGNGKIDSGMIGSKSWSAASSMPSAANRQIFSYDPSAKDAKGITFTWASLNASQQGILGNQDVVDYLRGDQSKEKTNSGSFRNRASILGDIVNSDPLFVGRDDAGYSALPGSEGSSYVSFAKTARREMIYVGANDGMLHAFDAGTGAEGGTEIFAYLPNSVITSTLVTLTDPAYSHHYFVNGSAQSGDVFYDSAWHTVLVGALGAGGKGVFALDITDPDAFDTGSVLWEYSSVDDADLGYTLPDASLARMANGQWAAIVANGYNSSTGKAALFVIEIKTGALIKKIEAEIATGANGLSSPVAVDVDNDKIVDYIYAGDLKGNLWKFDVSSSDTANWGVAYSGSAVFVAQDSLGAAQAITAKPAVAKATANGQTGGVMVYFGTGKYFETGDNVVPATPQVQSFYGIWDKCDKGSASGCNGVVSGRSSLQQQSILQELSAGSTKLADGMNPNGDIRIASNCGVGYGSTAPTTTDSPCTNNINRRGWFMDFVSPTAGKQGERIVSMPILRHGVVIFPTLIPNTNACTGGGTSWLMELDQFSGARLTYTPVDLNNDGKVDEKDMVVIDGVSFPASGFKSDVGIIDTPAVINCEDGLDCKYASGSSANLWVVKEKAPSSGGPALLSPRRLSWRQLL